MLRQTNKPPPPCKDFGSSHYIQIMYMLITNDSFLLVKAKLQHFVSSVLLLYTLESNKKWLRGQEETPMGLCKWSPRPAAKHQYGVLGAPPPSHPITISHQAHLFCLTSVSTVLALPTLLCDSPCPRRSHTCLFHWLQKL